ncbi:MAG: hypothetical protein IBJ00_00140 [Alphaproteobacteria bacterium]|nr:hypothetical protein [Alphaproteobacteria bacterium]
MTALLKRSLLILSMMILTPSLTTLGYASALDLNEASNKEILLKALLKGTKQVQFKTAAGQEKFQIDIDQPEKSKLLRLRYSANGEEQFLQNYVFMITENTEALKSSNEKHNYTYYKCDVKNSGSDIINLTFTFKIFNTNPSKDSNSGKNVSDQSMDSNPGANTLDHSSVTETQVE